MGIAGVMKGANQSQCPIVTLFVATEQNGGGGELCKVLIGASAGTDHQKLFRKQSPLQNHSSPEVAVNSGIDWPHRCTSDMILRNMSQDLGSESLLILAAAVHCDGHVWDVQSEPASPGG